MIESEICLDEYEEDQLELQQETCMVRLLYRCTICHQDYVSMEGLWNHLELHEVVEGCKDMLYQELEAKHKLHQCALCNDQRGYSESSYWIHVSKFHAERLKLPLVEQTNTKSDNRLVKQTVVPLITIVAKEPTSTNVEHRTTDDERLEQPLVEQLNEKKRYEPKMDCSICGEKFFSLEDYKAHHKMCNLKVWICILCGATFKRIRFASMHNGFVHGRNGNSKTMQLVQVHQLGNVAKLAARDKGPSNVKVSVSATNKHNGDFSDTQIVDGDLHAGIEKQLPERAKGSNDIRVGDIEVEETKLQPVNDQISSDVTALPPLPLATTESPAVRKKTGNRQWPCKICELSFDTISKRQYHRTVGHTKPKHKCPVCQRMFHLPGCLRRHAKTCSVIRKRWS